jgi:hypothetical protein
VSPANENPAGMQVLGQPPDNGQISDRRTILVTKSNQIYEVAKYQRDGDLLMFVDTQGRKGGVNINEVDWRKTTGMTTEARSGDTAVIARQTN